MLFGVISKLAYIKFYAVIDFFGATTLQFP